MAIKRISIDVGEHERALEALEEELSILSKLQHPNIISYLDSIKKRNSLYIIFEFIESGSIKDIVRKFGHFPEPLAVCRASIITMCS